MTAELSDEVRYFIMENIDSVAKLEVLHLLANSPEQGWTPDAVSRELRSTEAAARKYLSELTASGLLTTQDSKNAIFQYQPKRPELDLLVKKLIAAKATFYPRIIQLIYDRPIEKIRELADAFRIRKENGDG